MKYSLRFVWYIVRIVIIALSAFAILVAAFFIAMDSANVFVIVSDGMKARAENIIELKQNNLQQYFTSKFITNQSSQDNTSYAEYSISDIKYKLSVESIWCNPWRNTATVTVVEAIPEMAANITPTETGTEKKAEPPAWPRARYKIKCLRIGDYWRIDSIEKVEALPAEPTASPEPSSYITASPLPTSTSAQASPQPSPTPTKGK